MPAIMRSVVVLPAPLGPRKPNSSPLGTSRSIASTAVKLPYFFVSRRRLIIPNRKRRPVAGHLGGRDDDVSECFHRTRQHGPTSQLYPPITSIFRGPMRRS